MAFDDPQNNVVAEFQKQLAIAKQHISIMRDQRTNLLDQITALGADKSFVELERDEYKNRVPQFLQQLKDEKQRSSQLESQAAAAEENLRKVTTVLLAFKSGLIVDKDELFRIITVDEDKKRIVNFEDDTIQDLVMK